MLGYLLRIKGYFGVTFYSFDVLLLSVYLLGLTYLSLIHPSYLDQKNPIVLSNDARRLWPFCRVASISKDMTFHLQVAMAVLK